MTSSCISFNNISNPYDFLADRKLDNGYELSYYQRHLMLQSYVDQFFVELGMVLYSDICHNEKNHVQLNLLQPMAKHAFYEINNYSKVKII